MTSAEKKVRERYPDVEPAYFVGSWVPWVLFKTHDADAEPIGTGETLSDAWTDAASRLPATPATMEE